MHAISPLGNPVTISQSTEQSLRSSVATVSAGSPGCLGTDTVVLMPCHACQTAHEYLCITVKYYRFVNTMLAGWVRWRVRDACYN